MDGHVFGHWHVHQDQPLCEKEKKKQQEKTYIEKNLGDKGGKVQRSDAETKKKGKDSPIPCPSPVLALLLTEGSLAAVFFFFFFS